jgi:glucose/arabinose dehydrogenase/mono/diheme cytochrome c family protein
MTMSRRAPHRRARSLAAIGAAMLVAGCPPSQRSAPEPPASSAPAPTAQAPAAPASGAAPARVMSAEPPLPPPTGRRPFEGADLSPKPPVQPLAPADEQKRFVLPAGYRMEPVLTDPDISEPVQIAFDGDGRMYVAEMRSYMMDVEATNQFTRISRISRHEDRDGDGVYERHTVFVDSLVAPRFVMPFGKDAVLTKETNADDVWRFTDTDGDGRADRKELFTTNFGRSANIEHQEGSLFWAMDNWMYSTVNAFRVRWTPNGVRREPTGFNGAQWGATQDDDGKTWFQGGASGLPSSFQFPIVYGNFEVQDQYEPGFDVPWGAPVKLADMQGGMGAVRMPDGSLNRVTAGSGADVYRGHRLPADLRGDYLYGEVVGRIVRRVRPVVRDGLTQLRNVYQPEQAEFIRSTDPLFRPVEVKTAPDGTVYVVDMYHGIVQEAQWVPKGSYLRAKVEQYQLDRITGRGRIWRLTHDGMPRDREQPRMLRETPAQLVRHLRHPNGWWRDMAQQLLVLAQDRSVVPALTAMARRDTMLVARFHALWTLEGLGALDAALVREQMRDPSARMRLQAIRASESLWKAGDRSFAGDYRALAKDPDANVAIQAMLTVNLLKAPEAAALIREAQGANRARGVQEIATQLLKPRIVAGRGPGNASFSPAQRQAFEKGDTIYRELCTQCHGADATGTPAGGGQVIAPALSGSPRVQGHAEYVVKTLLHGLTGPIDGKNYPGGIMVPMGANDDAWIAAVATYVRNAFGNMASPVSGAEVARVRAATASRRTPWTYDELVASVPRLLAPAPWKVTASHAPAAAARAPYVPGWSSDTAQRVWMWVQVELPEPTRLTEIRFDSPPRYPPGYWGLPADRRPPVPQAFARGYRVDVSTDGSQWRQVSQGIGAPSTVIAFEPALAKLVRISLTASDANAPFWSVQTLRLWELPPSGTR